MSFSEEIKIELLEQKLNRECCMFAVRMGENFTEYSYKDISNFDDIFNKRCCIKEFIKGVFLSGGYVIDPNSEYHLEINIFNRLNSKMLVEILNKLKIKSKYIKRNNRYIVYIKEADTISQFLSYIGSYKAVLNFEEVRVEKEVRNNINRSINCETANLNKIIASAQKQIESINFLKQINKYDTLPDSLHEVAEVRMRNKQASLEELVKYMGNSITKSGINHRLSKIVKLAQEERNS